MGHFVWSSSGAHQALFLATAEPLGAAALQAMISGAVTEIRALSAVAGTASCQQVKVHQEPPSVGLYLFLRVGVFTQEVIDRTGPKKTFKTEEGRGKRLFVEGEKKGGPLFVRNVGGRLQQSV